jgi:hypothetical protein
MPATTGMTGAGYYDRHSAAQMSSIWAFRDWIEAAVATLPLPNPEHPVTVLDLGSAEGGNAIRVMATLVEGLRRRTHQPVQTIYSDLFSNDFNQLFAGLEQVQRSGRFPAGVYPGVVGGSFYGPLLPPGTVHLATSFNAIHWLDQLPAVPVRDFVVHRRPLVGRTESPETAAAFQLQAELDLVRFLQCRARELVPGGKLLLATPGATDEDCVGTGLFELLNDACRDLVDAGWLDPERYERLTVPVYFRTVAELRAPLERADSPVRGAFVVERAEAREAPVPFVIKFRSAGDVAAYAGAYTGFLRAISEPVVRAALDRVERVTETIDLLYERVRVRLLSEPERYSWRYIVAAALLTRC